MFSSRNDSENLQSWSGSTLQSVSFSADVREQWIRSYLRGKREAQGQNPDSISEIEVETWMTELEIMDVVSSHHGLGGRMKEAFHILE